MNRRARAFSAPLRPHFEVQLVPGGARDAGRAGVGHGRVVRLDPDAAVLFPPCPHVSVCGEQLLQTLFDDCLDHHRQLQRARGSRAVPRVVACAAPPPPPTRSSSSTTSRATAARTPREPGHVSASSRPERIWDFRGPTMSVSTPARVTHDSPAEQRHGGSSPGATRSPWSPRSSTGPSVAVVGPRLVDGDGRAELSFGRMIGPINELRQKRLVRGHAADRRASGCVEARRAASSGRTG